ncbi:hypothetical protein D3C86_2007630 [compost metagenome]
MKPDSRMDGSRINTVICIACSWVWARVEMSSPRVRLAAINSRVASSTWLRAPLMGTAKMK